MKIEITRNNKEFTVLDKNMLILKGRRPKWYSSELRFFHNSKTYEIKKKGFWSSSFIILESGHPIGTIHWSLKKSYKIILKNNSSSLQYWLKKEKVGNNSKRKEFDRLEWLDFAYLWHKTQRPNCVEQFGKLSLYNASLSFV